MRGGWRNRREPMRWRKSKGPQVRSMVDETEANETRVNKMSGISDGRGLQERAVSSVDGTFPFAPVAELIGFRPVSIGKGEAVIELGAGARGSHTIGAPRRGLPRAIGHAAPR